MSDRSSDLALVRSVVESNIPAQQKTAFQRVVDRLTNGKASQLMATNQISIRGDHVSALGRAARGGIESAGVGMALAELDAKVGLDLGPVPLDFVAGVLLDGVGVLLGSNTLSNEAINAANSCHSICAFRKWKSVIAKRKGTVTKTVVSGEEDEADPILRVAKRIK
jgi:hypothetical protein